MATSALRSGRTLLDFVTLRRHHPVHGGRACCVAAATAEGANCWHWFSVECPADCEYTSIPSMLTVCVIGIWNVALLLTFSSAVASAAAIMRSAALSVEEVMAGCFERLGFAGAECKW